MQYFFILPQVKTWLCASENVYLENCWMYFSTDKTQDYINRWKKKSQRYYVKKRTSFAIFSQHGMSSFWIIKCRSGKVLAKYQQLKFTFCCKSHHHMVNWRTTRSCPAPGECWNDVLCEKDSDRLSMSWDQSEDNEDMWWDNQGKDKIAFRCQPWCKKNCLDSKICIASNKHTNTHAHKQISMCPFKYGVCQSISLCLHYIRKLQ